MSDFEKEMKTYAKKLRGVSDKALAEEEEKIVKTMCRRLSAITAVRICRDADKDMTEKQLAEKEENAYKGYTEEEIKVYNAYKGMTEKQLAEEAEKLSRTGKGIAWASLLIRFSVLVAVYFRKKAEKPNACA